MDIVVATNISLVVIVVNRTSTSISASAFTSRLSAASCSCPPWLVVLPPVNLWLHHHHLPLPLPSMVGCYVIASSACSVILWALFTPWSPPSSSRQSMLIVVFFAGNSALHPLAPHVRWCLHPMPPTPIQQRCATACAPRMHRCHCRQHICRTPSDECWQKGPANKSGSPIRFDNGGGPHANYHGIVASVTCNCTCCPTQGKKWGMHSHGLELPRDRKKLV